MGNNIRFGLFQQDIIWNDIFANQFKIESLIKNLSSLPDILLLPEMYTTGFNDTPGILSKNDLAGQLAWQQSISVKYNICVFGSVIEYNQDTFFNRLFFTRSDGSNDYYDKRHLFGIGGESEFYTSGESRKIFSFGPVQIMPQICYDLRFPVWSRNNIGYHILIYSANWPANRRIVWDTLLKARAIENQCYTIGINRTGSDGNSINYDGGSAVYGPKGETLLLLDEKEQYAEIILSIDDLLQFKNSFPAYKDADGFEIKTRKF